MAVQLKKNPELVSPENIVKLVSSNPIIAVFEFVVLYLLKGISMVFPSAILNIAAGMVFEFPFSALVSGLGIFVEYIALYVVGRFLGKDIVEEFKQKYLIVNKIDSIQNHNSFFTSFIIRIMGVVSYDMASIYLGASGVEFGGFIMGSMCGAALNIIIDGLVGKYIFNPLSWQLWVVVIIRGAVIAMAILVKIYVSKKINKNTVI
ncbi:MAG: TVP38/TMEM64 family protein [Lachnospiraceae bacterium]